MKLIDQLLEAYPDFSATDDVRRFCRVSIQARSESLRRKRQFKRSALVGAFTILLGVTSFGLGPRALAVYRLQRIAGSVADAQTAEIDEYTVQPNGEQILNGRELYDRGKWRTEHGTSIQVWKAGKLWSLDPIAKRVIVQAAPNGPAAYSSNGFSVKAMISDIARWKWTDQIEIADGQFKGVAVSRVTITNSNKRERLVVLANRETSMPIAYQMESKTIRGWKLSGLARAKFDQPLDQKLFATNFNPTYPVVDLDQFKATFKEKIEKPLASFAWKKDRKISIRVVDVNPNGHVFVLYTDGETLIQRHKESEATLATARQGSGRVFDEFRVDHPIIKLQSSIGVEYASDWALQPYIDGPSERFRSGIVLKNGEVLQGAWFIPTRPVSWKPLSIKVTFDNQASISYQAKFVSVSTSLLPDWAPLMGVGPHTDEDILIGELGTHRRFLEANSDVKAVIASYEAELELKRKMESRGMGPWSKGDLFLGLYRQYLKLGDHPTALDYLMQAADDPVAAEGLTEALAKEGLR